MEPELVTRAQQGDQRAFEALTVRSHARLYRLAYGILRDPTLAEDVTQQAFLDIWRFLRRLRDPKGFEAWSYRILLDACREEAARRPEPPPPGGAVVTASRGPDPFGTGVDREQMGRAFARLTLEQRTPIVMRYLLDLEVEDMAAVLGSSTGTAASRLQRALAALRAAIEADGGPGADAGAAGEGA